MFGADGGGVVPKIVAVHIAVVKPHPYVVRVVNALAGAGVERPAPRNEVAARRPDWVEHRLFQHVGAGVAISRKGVIINRYAHAPGGFIVRNLNLVWLSRYNIGQQQE